MERTGAPTMDAAFLAVIRQADHARTASTTEAVR